jgi:hypothetical protein
LEKAEALMLFAENPNERLMDFFQLRGTHSPGSINDDAGVGRKQSTGAYTAALVEPAAYEVGSVESHGILILANLAGDLAENQIVALQCCKH